MTLREIDLSHLTDEERNKVLEVLQRDEHLRDSEQKRVRNLKDEVKNLRLKGTIREGRSATRTCARCRESFGIIFNTGSICAKCQHRVCKKCQESVSPGKWICVFCFRQMEFEAKSGNWFYSKFPRSMRDRATNEIISGGKLVHDAISSGSFVDDLDPEMVSAFMASVSPRLPFLSSVGENNTALETHACVGSEHVLETFHRSFGSTEFVLPRELTVLGEDAQFGASEQKGDVTTMGACGHAEDSNCSADLESESIQDAIISGIPMMLVQSENPVATEQTESGIRTEFADLEQITNVDKGKVEVSEEVLPADQYESGMSMRLEDSNSPEHMALKGSKELTGLVNVTGSSALTRDEDVEQLARPVIGEKGKECEPLELCDSNDSVFEDEEGGELRVSNKCEDSKKGFPALCCAECVDYSANENRDVVVPLRSSSNDSSGMPFNGSNETSIPVTVVSDFKDLSVYPASGSGGSPMPPLATDSEDVTNSTVLAIDCECSLDLKSKCASVSELMGPLDKDISAAHPANEDTTVDNLASHHLTTMLAHCHFMNEGDISESCSNGEDMSSSEISSHGTFSSCPVYKDAIDDNMLVVNTAETKAGVSEDISAALLTNSTNSSTNLADGKQKLPVMLLGMATDLADKDGRIPVSPSQTSDLECKTPVTLPAPTDVTGISCSNGSCEVDVSPTKTLSCSEQISDSSALESDKLETSSSVCDSVVLNNNCSNGSAGNQDSVRSKVGALLAKYGRNVDHEKSPDVRNALTEEKNSLLLNGRKSLKTVSAFQMKPSSSSTPKQNQAPGQSTSSTTPAGSTPLSQQQRPGNTVTTSPPQQLNPATSFQPSWTKVASRNQSTLPPKGGEAQESQVVPQSTGALSSVPQITIIPDKEEAVFPTGDSLSMQSVDEVDFEQSLREDASPPYKTNLSRLSAMSASTESVMSYYSCAGEVNYGKIAVTGEIQFGINYNPKTSNLEVTIRRCKDLAVADPKKNRSDPYVKCYLLPDKSRTGKRKTHCKKNTLNPVFDEILKFSVKRGEVESRTLSIMVWNYDRFGRNDFLGEVDLPLTSDILQDTALKWYKLGTRVAPPMDSMLAYKGDLDVSLKYDNARRVGGKIVSTLDRGELQVLVKQARNLTPLRSSDASDPFCQAFLLPNRSKHDKQKTAVVKHSCNPVWNHTFIFEGLSDDELRESSLELAIWDHDRLTSHEFLGGVRLNLGTGRSNGNNVDWMDAKGDEMSLWQAMLDRPNTWIDGTLLLRVHMTPRK